VVQVNDLSRSLAAFDPASTLVVVVEMSKASWLVSGVIPGVERQPLKKLEPDATALLRSPPPPSSGSPPSRSAPAHRATSVRGARTASARALSTSVHASSTA
jgi:hypothetical protein